jgi:hypothetical protein
MVNSKLGQTLAKALTLFFIYLDTLAINYNLD